MLPVVRTGRTDFYSKLIYIWQILVEDLRSVYKLFTILQSPELLQCTPKKILN